MATSIEFSVNAPPDYPQSLVRQEPAACSTWPHSGPCLTPPRAGPEATHTVAVSTNAAQTPQSAAVHPASPGDHTDWDVLIAHAVSGTRDALAAAARMPADAGASRVRTPMCVVNEDRTGGPPAKGAVTYIGTITHGWVIFPWEGNDEHEY